MKQETKDYKVIECTIAPDGKVTRKVYKPNLNERAAWKLSDEMNEKNSLLDTDLSKPLITYMVSR